VLEFNPEKIKQVEAEFNAKKNRGYRYTVTDPNNGSKQDTIRNQFGQIDTIRNL